MMSQAEKKERKKKDLQRYGKGKYCPCTSHKEIGGNEGKATIILNYSTTWV